LDVLHHVPSCNWPVPDRMFGAARPFESPPDCGTPWMFCEANLPDD